MTSPYGQPEPPPDPYPPGQYPPSAAYQPGAYPAGYGPYPQYAPYGQPGQFPPYSPAALRTNSLAVASLVCGLAQFIGLSVIAGIPAIVLGTIALKQIGERGEGGRGMAIAGLVLGCVSLVLVIVIVIAFVVALRSAPSTCSPATSCSTNVPA
jgi:uncharacterized protein DUF4190